MLHATKLQQYTLQVPSISEAFHDVMVHISTTFQFTLQYTKYNFNVIGYLQLLELA